MKSDQGETKDYNELFLKRYKNLNKAQKKAVDTIDGPLMVVAGPGSGKTELLSLRIGNILRAGSAKASNILCLTFTETAAKNMRERLENLIGPDAYRVAIYTFHGFCTDIIGRYPEYFFEATSFTPASELVVSEILEEIFEKLPHKHILGGYHKERGYAYLKEAESRIKDIKKGGLTPERLREILDENAKSMISLNEILREYLPERVGKDAVGAFEKMRKAFLDHGSNIAVMYAKEIENALNDCSDEGKTTPLSTWKSSFTTKDEEGLRVLKDSNALPKLYALCEIYKEYQEKLHGRGYFDFEDMVLMAVEALTKHVTLRTEIEEMYQYILVDEFQDTNNAQLSLVKAISSNEVHEGRPNVCVVGDDDQAIYKFQGAEISNIHSFKELYKDVETIVLTENYRSTQRILDFARKIVVQGVNRLETRYKEIRKDLIAKNENLKAGEIFAYSFSTEEEEYAYIASEVKKLLVNGVSPKEIALITRKHAQLIALLPYLDSLSIPYTYTRKENVFDEVHVKELVTLCQFLASVGDTTSSRDDLLPTILAFPFWNLDRISVWRVAEHAKRENISWLSAMEESKEDSIRTVARFLIELGIASQTTPLEVILDTLIGSRDSMTLVIDEEDDGEMPYAPLTLSTAFVSPYKEYYFGENALKENGSAYISFLSSLRVFIKALREYREGEQLLAHDVGDFVSLHTEYGIPLTNNTPFAHNENSVSLLTSHSAKGLEFDYVFTVSVNDSIWAGRPRGNKINFPINLPLGTSLDDEDDFIRLFYVALTRARHTLYVTHHDSPLRFLSLTGEVLEKKSFEMKELVAEGLHVYHAPPYAKDEMALLMKVVDGYTLSPTHMNNFLNIIDGGPMRFLEQNLLRFPQAKSPSSVYGTAVHKAIEDAHIYARKEKKLAPLTVLINSFTKELSKGRLRTVEVEKLRSRGEKIITRYYELKKDELSKGNTVELNFAKEMVVVDGAHLTGKIDMILSLGEKDEKYWRVVDLKTGKGFDSFVEDTTNLYDLLKIRHYKYQLALYKLLVENSRDYHEYIVKEGVLEFVEEETDEGIQQTSISFDSATSQEEVERVKRLAVAVYKKIVSLDFPDTSKYEKTIEGVQEFEDDLIAGRI